MTVALARRPATPYARRLARERGLALDMINGSGPSGRIVAADIEAYVARPAVPPSLTASSIVSAVATTVDLANLRRLLADFVGAGVAVTLDDMIVRAGALALEVLPGTDPRQISIAWEAGAGDTRREVLLAGANHGLVSALHQALAAGSASEGAGSTASPATLSVRRLAQSGIRPAAMPLLPGYRMRLVVSADADSTSAECLFCFDARAVGEDDAAAILAGFRNRLETPLLLLA